MNLISTANAADIRAKLSKNGTNYGFIPVNEDRTINVRIKNSNVMDVRIKGLYAPSYWPAIPVKRKIEYAFFT